MMAGAARYDESGSKTEVSSGTQAGALLSARSGIVDVQGFAEDVTFDLLSRAFAGAEIGVLAPGAEGRTETAEKLLVAWR